MVNEETSADLWALGIEHDRACLVRALLESLSKIGDGSSVGLRKRPEVSKFKRGGSNCRVGHLLHDLRERS